MWGMMWRLRYDSVDVLRICIKLKVACPTGPFPIRPTCPGEWRPLICCRLNVFRSLFWILCFDVFVLCCCHVEFSVSSMIGWIQQCFWVDCCCTKSTVCQVQIRVQMQFRPYHLLYVYCQIICIHYTGWPRKQASLLLSNDDAKYLLLLIPYLPRYDPYTVYLSYRIPYSFHWLNFDNIRYL